MSDDLDFNPDFDRLILLDKIEECLTGSSINYNGNMVTLNFHYTIEDKKSVKTMEIPIEIFNNITNYIKNNNKETESFKSNKYKYNIDYFNNTTMNTKLYEIRKYYRSQ